MTALTNRHGQSQDIDYDEVGRIATVTDRTMQRALNFTYDSNNRLSTVTDPGGAVYTYAYDTSGRLAQVVWPGAIPGNPSRQYLYNEPVNTSNTNLPYALTGILDENGGRYATYRYDAQGRGIASEHANGIELHQLSYNADGSTRITDALGHDRTYRYQTVLGVKHSAGQNQPAGPGCPASASHLNY
ncbi:MAG: RHS repeat protein, partial [Methylomonas sp.]|nr:RHS repeat protein [Methylomonas sp.]